MLGLFQLARKGGFMVQTSLSEEGAGERSYSTAGTSHITCSVDKVKQIPLKTMIRRLCENEAYMFLGLVSARSY